MGKITDDFLGIDPPRIPDPIIPDPAPKIRKDTENLPDDAAIRASKERIEQMKRRKGRSTLRQDLNVAGAGVGAGVAIPR